MKWALYNLTSTTQSGGVETGVWRLANTLAAMGHRVDIIGGTVKIDLPRTHELVRVAEFGYRDRDRFPDLGSRARKFMERISFARNAGPTLRNNGYDRVMLFKTYDVAPGLWYMRGRPGMVGYLSGGTEYYPGYAWLARKLGYLACVSQFNAAQMTKATGLAPEVNYLGVDTDCFYPAEPDNELAEAAGIEPGDEVIVSAVRLVALKGVQRAIQAMALLAEKRPRLRMLVAGQGPYKPELEKEAQRLGLEHKVFFTGLLPQERLAGFYALGHVAVFPSLGEEALGLSPAEAMACGVPVVASDLGGLPEVVGDCGILVRQRDVQSLATAMERLIDDGPLRERMISQGKQRVSKLFTWQACAQRMIDGFKPKGG